MHGMSSIGVGQLCGIAKALDVPVSFFHDGSDGVSVPMNSDADRQSGLRPTAGSGYETLSAMTDSQSS
jgi:hypothetical protein